MLYNNTNPTTMDQTHVSGSLSWPRMIFIEYLMATISIETKSGGTHH